MSKATILSIVFNFVTCGDHTYKAIWMLDIHGYLELWVKDGDNHDTFAVVVIMTEYIVGHILKAITYHQLLLKICTCGTIQGCTTIKIIHENKVICTRVVMYCTTIRICAINWVNTVITKGVGGGLRLTFRHNGTSCVPKELSMVYKPHYKAKQAVW